MKIGQVFRWRREHKEPVRRTTKAPERHAGLFVETLEDRTVPSTFPSLPFPTPTLLDAASANANPALGGGLVALAGAGLLGGLNGGANGSLFNQVFTDLIALSNTLTLGTTLLGNSTTSTLPGGLLATLEIDAMLGQLNLGGLQSLLPSGAASNPTSLLDSAFGLIMQELGSTGGLAGSVPSNVGFPLGNL
ncbi:MAG TPA: hypothetical protein VE999_16860 [Gemmataceae bacterium]|nr:hypothetical protein [Gemmataceae bacterium]